MPFTKGKPTANPKGRPRKPVEDAQQSVLLRLFDATAEIAVVKAQITKAKAGNTTSATWLWDRKYGKVTERVEQSGTTHITISYADSDRTTD